MARISLIRTAPTPSKPLTAKERRAIMADDRRRQQSQTNVFSAADLTGNESILPRYANKKTEDGI